MISFQSKASPSESGTNWIFILAILALMIIGGAFVYSATTSGDSVNTLPWFRQFYFRQVLWYTIGTAAAVAICFVDYHVITRWAPVFYWASMLLLLGVLLKGKSANGAVRWISLGFFQLQPSEFAKLGCILAQANYLSRPVEELAIPSVFFRSLALTMLPFFLILKEPDLKSSLLLLPMTFAMMYVAGVPRRYLGRLFFAGFLVAGLLMADLVIASSKWQVIKLQEYQRQRLMVFFGKDFASTEATPEERKAAEKTQRAKSFNIEQALISVGSGGITGKGWRQGTQNALGFLPYAYDDFIFSVIAEETGFVGSVTVILLYAVVLFSGIKIAGEARDHLGKLLSVGIVMLIFSHVFINIGMNIRIMPVTGLPLPLLSYGGSSVLCSLIAMGLLHNVYIYRKSY